MSKLQKYLLSRETFFLDGYQYRKTLPYIVCKDGAEFSVQTGETLYSEPRSNAGPWTKVEVGFPKQVVPDSWKPYAEGDKNPSDIYAYIPIELVEAYIEEHGGMVNEKRNH